MINYVAGIMLKDEVNDLERYITFYWNIYTLNWTHKKKQSQIKLKIYSNTYLMKKKSEIRY